MVGSEGLKTRIPKIKKGSSLDQLKSYMQLAHPFDIEDLADYNVTPFGLDFLRLHTVPVPKDHPAKPYLEHRSHDGGIVEFSVNHGEARLVLNDYDGWRLAGAYENRIGKNSGFTFLRPEVPVELRFQGITEFAAYQFEFDGRLIHLKHSLRSNLRKIYGFDVDWVLQFDDAGITLIMELRVFPARHSLIEPGDQRGVGSAWHPHNVLICISCREISVQENQRESWIVQFGENTVWIWDEYLKIRKTRSMPDWNDFIAFLEEIGA